MLVTCICFLCGCCVHGAYLYLLSIIFVLMHPIYCGFVFLGSSYLKLSGNVKQRKKA